MQARITWPAILLLAAVAVAGCSKKETGSGPIASLPLRISQRNEPADLDPATGGFVDEFFIIRALSEGLVNPSGDGGNVVPAAASSWETSADGLTWTFHLRADGHWSNGEPVTAQDFVDSYRRLLTPATGAMKAALFYPVKNAREFVSGTLSDFKSVGFLAPDSRTVVITLAHPTPNFLAFAASGNWIPVNPRVVARYGREWTRPEHYVGNGPFLLAEWEPGKRIVVRRNPGYHSASQILVPEIQFIRFDDENSEERAYRAGELEVTMAAPSSKHDTYLHEHPGEWHQAPLVETRYLSFNTQRRPLNDERVRRALSLALDRKGLVEEVMRGGQIGADRLVPPSLGVPSPATMDPSATSSAIKQARSLLVEAGYPGGRGFPHLELSSWRTHLELLEAVQEMWKKGLGIEINISIREGRAHLAALRSGSYDIGVVALIPDVADPLEVLESFATVSPDNYPHWSDSRYDEMLSEASLTSDSAKRMQLLSSAEGLLLEKCPLAPVYFNSQNWLMRPCVQGWRQDGLWNRSYAGVRVEPGKTAP